MKFFAAVLILCSLAVCFSWPVKNYNLDALVAVDAAVQGDANIDHIRLARHHRGGYGGYGGYGGGYPGGGYGGGYPGGGYGGGYPGGGGGYGGSDSYASASAQSSGYGGGYGEYGR